MNNKIVPLNLKSTKNSFSVNKVTATKNIINPNLIDTNTIYNSNEKAKEDNLKDLNLIDSEYTFEELMEYAENRKNEIRLEKLGIQKSSEEFISIYGDYNTQYYQYGGSQMDFKYNNTELLEDPIILEMLKQTYPNASMEDYEYYLYALTTVGCGYTAFVNCIFENYQGREDEFLEKFGFPMYEIIDGVIDFNYEYLILDLFNYIWGNSGYTIQELYGDVTPEATDGALVYQEIADDNSNKKVTGTSGVSWLHPNLEDYCKWLKDKYSIDGEIIRTQNYELREYDEKVLKFGSDEWKEWMKSQGFDVNEDVVPDGTDQKVLELNEEVTLLRFKMYIEEELTKGCVYLSVNDCVYIDPDSERINVGNHAVTLVDVTPDGLIVSSWGTRYIIEFDQYDKVESIATITFNN